MDASEILRTIATLNSRAVRAERIVTKYEQELAALRHSHQQMKSDFEETVKVAELLYETNRRVGVVTDYLLKHHGIHDDDEEPKSFEAMFTWVQKQVEYEGQPKPEGKNTNSSGSGDVGPAE
ncbi:hypothetical protein N7523_010277 [Penicillium sp. IBT 18751x]|nr:hypothetical protein N7523_010268 [Penicillium sp. IBT 18751x]KAJ6105203.1 hypothetical protein N7523_010277 [Penicillium sp. IBT 18751x]